MIQLMIGLIEKVCLYLVSWNGCDTKNEEVATIKPTGFGPMYTVNHLVN